MNHYYAMLLTFCLGLLMGMLVVIKSPERVGLQRPGPPVETCCWVKPSPEPGP